MLIVFGVGPVCGAMPKITTGWVTNGVLLDRNAWAAVCNNTADRRTCSAAACGLGYTGTLSAVCAVSFQVLV
jgi:hypothetical protein